MPASTRPGINAPTVEQWPAPVAVWEHTGQSGQFHVRVDRIPIEVNSLQRPAHLAAFALCPFCVPSEFSITAPTAARFAR